MKIGSINLDIRRDKWIKNRTGIKEVLVTKEGGDIQNSSSIESLISCPPYCTILSPTIPVYLSIGASAFSALLSAAVGRLAVDMDLTVDCYIGDYYVQGL